ncbi:uncharacterized protein VDAG_04369 [Verticillium dahliae VdLs.17]|uniref:Luciferase domain-containing protein n=1 Tax=Verticillium dahliae (strain VdLs.17 / ATCC MYA-4575 / FGSC 10137) TaxID=498257 RepID=G2X245_VERDV|nr:uncharacterized protein VDAG_04369 [Verticillium dahliae VdLs.17]EGY22931.1 hypothetical protein VDAG_04369 [Verticillium dahliae VdLs.17]
MLLVVSSTASRRRSPSVSSSRCPSCCHPQRYNNFLGLGPGGTPPTFQGYARIAWLRLWALRDPFTPPDPDPTPGRLPTRGRLLVGTNSAPSRTSSVHGSSSNNTNVDALPYRPGPRPVVAGIAPQRQLDQHGAKPQPLRHGPLVHRESTVSASLRATPSTSPATAKVCHVHDSDHSLHMTLHPDDIAEVLRKGWGQRHPLARKGWFGAMPVPEEFLMVYAPRDDQELQIVCRIIEAAIWYVTAESEQIEVLYRSRTPSIASSK